MDFKYVNWKHLMLLRDDALQQIIADGGPAEMIVACRLILSARKKELRMDLDDEHTVIIYQEPGESKFRVLCETCHKSLQNEKGSTRFQSYPEAYGAAREHEREVEENARERQG